jgi:hypothetical protein
VVWRVGHGGWCSTTIGRTTASSVQAWPHHFEHAEGAQAFIDSFDWPDGILPEPLPGIKLGSALPELRSNVMPSHAQRRMSKAAVVHASLHPCCCLLPAACLHAAPTYATGARVARTRRLAALRCAAPVRDRRSARRLAHTVAAHESLPNRARLLRRAFANPPAQVGDTM